MSTNGLTFKNGVIATGNINIQPEKDDSSLVFASVTLDQNSNGTPTLNTFDFSKILTIHQNENVVLIRKIENLSITQASQPISLPKSATITAISPTNIRDIQQITQTDEKLVNKLNKPSPRFLPYESLTGVSQVRPEILLATNFEPIYNEGHKHSSSDLDRKNDQYIDGLNEYGEFIDAQIQVNHLRHEAIGKLIADLKIKDDTFATQLETKENQFNSHIQKLQSYTSYLRDVISKINNLKQTFNLKNENVPVDFIRISYDHFQDARQQLVSDLNKKFKQNIGFKSVLSELGFSNNNQIGFSSTKIYFQSLYEFKNVLKGYTNNLLSINPIEQRDDANPVYINKHKNIEFGLGFTITTPVAFDTLINLRINDKSGASELLSSIQQTRSVFDNLFYNVQLSNDESKISLLLQFLSKEFNYSKALNNEEFTTYLKNKFGFTINQNSSNTNLFDNIIGNLGDKITDKVNLFSENSLATLGQKIDGTTAILPFETSYISYENNAYTPGSVYYIDKLLDIGNVNVQQNNNNTTSENVNFYYNSSNLEKYAFGSVYEGIDNLTKLARNLNLIPQIFASDTSFDQTIGQSNKLLENILSDYLDLNKMTMLKTIDSDVIAIFNLAQNDSYLKSLLFHYVINRTYGQGNFGANGNTGSTSVLDELIKQIVTVIGSKLSQDKRVITKIIDDSTKQISGASSKESLINVLKISNNFLSIFFRQFKRIFDAFKFQKSLYTTYSHIENTTISMLIFETLLTIVNKYVKKTFVGYFTSKSNSSIGKEFYSTKSSLESSSTSIQTVNAKLSFENDMRIKLMYVIISSLQQIYDVSSNVTSELRNQANSKIFNEIQTIIGNKNLFQMIMNDQQIHLIESFVYDIVDKLATTNYVTGRAGINQSTSTESDVQISLGNQKDDITILDDSLISQKVRQSLFSYLGQNKFTSKASSNIRLLTIGVPLGFSQDLKQNILISQVNQKSFEPKQTDIVKVNVYKVDVEYQDLIFKPQTFLFELNRYVVRNDKRWRWVPIMASLMELLNGTPTRDFSYIEEKLKNQIMYFSDENNPLTKSPQYDFLTKEQKFQIVENHIASYFYEIYVKLLTGMKLSEYDFLINSSNISNKNVDQSIINKLIDERISKFITPTSNALNLTDLSAYETNKATQTNVAHSLMLIQDFQTMQTQFSDNVNASKRLFSPKVFERIFTVAVDPNLYEIDVFETLKTLSGQEMYNKLLKQGRIVTELAGTSIYAGANTQVEKIKLVNRDKNAGDMLFEKYFVNFETVLNTEV